MNKKRRIWKTALNLTIAAPLAVVIWWNAACIMPTARMEFRRAERINLLSQHSEIQAVVKHEGTTWTVGVGEGFVAAGHRFTRELYWFDRQTGGTLLILSPNWNPGTTPLVLVVDGPKDAASAQLTLHLKAQAYVDASGEGSGTFRRELTQPDEEGRGFLKFDEGYVLAGVQEGESCFSFPLERHYPNNDTELGYLEGELLSALLFESAMDWQMEVVFYDASGQALGTAIQDDEALKIAQREQYGWG